MIPQHHNGIVIKKISGAKELIRRGMIRDVVEKELGHNICSQGIWNERTLFLWIDILSYYPDSQVHGAYMGPIWDRQDPGGLHIGPMNLAIRVGMCVCFWICHCAFHIHMYAITIFPPSFKQYLWHVHSGFVYAGLGVDRHQAELQATIACDLHRWKVLIVYWWR